MTETLPNIGAHTADYTDPVQRLLSIGESRAADPASWLDYAAKVELRSEQHRVDPAGL